MLVYQGETQLIFALVDLDQSFLINWGIFLIFAIIIYHLILKPVLQLQDVRHERTIGAKEAAADMDAKALAQVQQYENLISEASRTGNEEVQQVRDNAKAQANDTVNKARGKAQAILDEKMPQIHATYEENRTKLQATAENLSEEIVSKVLAREAN